MSLIRVLAVEGTGYGSALANDPSQPECFYMLTDRGPNFEVPDDGSKGFLEPSFRPHIGRFERRGDTLVRTRIIPLTNFDGQPITGLPNPPSEASTCEIPVALDGSVIPFDPHGVDPEGLVAMPDGSFWIADEYGPALMHVNAEGRTIERVSPFTSGRSTPLPRVLARRWPNHGFEGLTLLPDGKTLATIAQSALDNPKAGAGKKSRNVRILLFDTMRGATRQYIYVQEEAGISTSALAAVSMTGLLAIEHDKKFTYDHKKPSQVKRIYQVDLSRATDVSDPKDRASGLLVGKRVLEALSVEQLATAGIQPAEKGLLVDLVAIGYPHDKPEGLAVLADGTIAVLNDDDFGIASDKKGGIVTKVLPGTTEVDRSFVYLLSGGDFSVASS
ncbi:MAG: esterase-like activity of phytase family protein [Gemmatimonadaceae bacterium]